MATEKTLAVRQSREERLARKKLEKQFEAQRAQQKEAVQMVTALAMQIYSENVVLPTTADTFDTPADLYAYYERQVHKSMDAAIAFIRAQNTYDDRGRVRELPPIVPEPTDANGSPVTLEG